jgi:large subunit ribosomal protein L5
MLQKYNDEIKPALQKEFDYKNVMQIPAMHKIVVNVGLGEAIKNPKMMDEVVEELTVITGQRPVVQKARKSVASFKLRQGMKIGCSVTLRGKMMWAFMDKLITLALPRIRDFRGVSRKAFDGRGNYTLGLKEQLVFPEIDYDKVNKTHGMNITFVTSAQTDDECRSLLKQFGVPFREK